ncbi:alkaline phosphatase [Bryobacterales bacterium F-183]|nr:alkaline phosphatase [Bryobacterales bacterium F-183]
MRHLLVIAAAAAAALFAQDFKLTRTGGFATRIYEQGAAEIAAYDAATKRLFFVNAQLASVEALDISDPANPKLAFRIFIPRIYGRTANSVAVSNGVLAVAVESDPKTDPGYVAFYNANGNLQKAVKVGAQPDMITFTPDGTKVLTANEGEPSNNYAADPEGSVSIIDITKGIQNLTDADVVTAHFRDFTRASLDPRIRIYGRNATVAQDLEPEYIAVSPDSKTAYVTLQENNALGVLDIASGKFTAVVALGFKDHNLPGNGIDASDRDNAINIQNWPVFGMYQPDAIAAFSAKGKTWLITANEGDAREWGDFVEEARVSTLRLDPTAFPNAAALQANGALGRLTVTRLLGDTDNDGDYDQLYALGGRSFSIWSSDGKLVWDSGDQLERLTAERYPQNFNASNNNNTLDDRSDNKGPEPEGVAVSTINGRTYAFIGLERIGGVMVYDVTDPERPTYVAYTNNRDFTAATNTAQAGDLGPEGILVIPAAGSPNGKPMLVTANEISGTVSLFSVDAPPAAVTTQARITGISGATAQREVLLDATTSTGPGLTYQWRSIGKSAAVIPQASDLSKIAVQFAQGPGDYVLELTVTDNTGAQSKATTTITYTGR